MLSHINLMCSIKSHQQATIAALCLNQKCMAEPISCLKCLNEIHFDHINDVKYLDDLQKAKQKKYPVSQIKDAFKRFRDSITEYLRMIEVQFENYIYPFEQFLKKQTLNQDQFNKLGVILKQAPIEQIGSFFEEQFEGVIDTVETEIDNFFNSLKGFSECTWKGQFSKETEEMRDLGKILYKQGKYMDSLNLINNVLSQNENDLEMIELKACSLYQLAFYEECIVEFEKAIQLNQKNADLYYWIGGACQELKQYEKAIKSYQKAKELNPQRYQSLINYIKICQQRMQGQ